MTYVNTVACFGAFPLPVTSCILRQLEHGLGVMSVTQGSKHSAQNTNNYLKKTPIKSNQNTKMEDKSTEKEMNKNLGSKVKLQDIFELISGMSKKMDKLDIIQENMENIQTELKEVRKSIEYAHSEIDDLKKENEKSASLERNNRTPQQT